MSDTPRCDAEAYYVDDDYTKYTAPLTMCDSVGLTFARGMEREIATLTSRATTAEAQRDAAEAKVEQLREALGFYANAENWQWENPPAGESFVAWIETAKPSPIARDFGQLAAQALSTTPPTADRFAGWLSPEMAAVKDARIRELEADFKRLDESVGVMIPALEHASGLKADTLKDHPETLTANEWAGMWLARLILEMADK